MKPLSLCAFLLLSISLVQAADSSSDDEQYQFIVTGCVVTAVKEFGDVLCVEFEGGQRAGSLGRQFVDSMNGLSVSRKTEINEKNWRRLVASARAVLNKKAIITVRDMDFTMIRGGCLIFTFPPSTVEIRASEAP